MNEQHRFAGSGQKIRLERFKAYNPTAAELRAASRREVEDAETLTRGQQIISWICCLPAAGSMIEPWFFKFTGAEESIYIFSKIGLEPWGRHGSGVMELIATILLLTPRFAWAGALLSLGVISGALVCHLTVLGIVVQDDGGLLFGLAITVFVTSAITAFLHRRQIPVVSQLFKTQIA